MAQNDFASVVAAYQEKRALAWAFAAELFPHLNLALGPISYRDAVTADHWTDQWTDSAKRPTWEWVEMFTRYNHKRAFKRFEVASRNNGQLCALSYGMPSNNRLILMINAIGRAPGDNPLSGEVFPIVLACASAYARLLASQEIWVCDPINARVAAYYESHGLEPVRNSHGVTTHLVMRLAQP
jgi:hypothetical protein